MTNNFPVLSASVNLCLYCKLRIVFPSAEKQISTSLFFSAFNGENTPLLRVINQLLLNSEMVILIRLDSVGSLALCANNTLKALAMVFVVANLV
jgi:hypothetical protein